MWTRVETVLLTVFINGLIGHSFGRTISCVCTTNECEEKSTNVCTTNGQCYTQFLDLKDGSNPITRGCIVTKTPLLCENRRPAINSSWPLLSCCGTNLCNQDIVPTLPLKLTPEKYSTVVSNSSISGESNLAASVQKSISNSDIHSPAGAKNSTDSKASDSTSEESQASPKLISPVYIAVLVIGICSLIAIGIVAVFMLRKHGRLYDTDYGAMERSTYLKGHHQVAREDPELQMPLPRAANGIYDNKVAVGT